MSWITSLRDAKSGTAAACFIGISSAASLACVAVTDDAAGTSASSLDTVKHLVPARDIGGDAVADGDGTGFFANVDDGTSFASADDFDTSVHNRRRRSRATFTVGLAGDGDPGGATRLDVHVRAMVDASSRGNVKLTVFDGDTSIATGPVHALGGDWQDLTDSFAGISIASGHEIRVQVTLARTSGSGFVRVTQLWADASGGATAPPPGPTPPPPPPPSTTCSLVTDHDVHAEASLAKPGYLKSAVDPAFGTRITRITGDPGTTVPVVGGTWGDRERHHYSKDQAWNADMSLLYLEERAGNRLFLDGHTYQVLFAHAEESIDAARWHPRDPNTMLYVGDHDIRTLDVRTGTRTTVATFSGYSGFTIGQAEGNLSDDGSKISLMGTSPAGKNVAFVYDLVAKQKFPDIVLGASDDSATVSPKGNYVVVGHEDSTTTIFDLQGRLVARWTEVGLPDHYDLTVDADGAEVAVGSGRTELYAGQIVKRRLADGVTTLLSRGGYGSHTTTRNLARPGWAYASFFESNENPPYSKEIAAIKLDGSGTVQRLGHHRSTEDTHDYYAEAQPSPSPDGSKVIFASDWGDPSGPIQAYVIDLPDVGAGACR
jgi:hypothetical protein